MGIREQFTVGVEEEYQLVQPDSGRLRSGAQVVRQADRSGEVEGEVQDTMLEIGTPVSRDTTEVAAALRERRFQASAAAATEDLEIMAAGIHPFSGWRGQQMTDADRPRMLVGLFGQLLRRMHICGMHVHVSVPEECDRIRLMNVVRAYGPHLLALSCSSPYYLGEDSGFASFRTIAWRGFSFVGAPPRCSSEAEYRGFLQLLIRAGVIPDERTVYWSVRPSSRYRTLEMRMCDCCPRVSDAVAITALARALVVAAAQEKLPPIGAPLSPSLQDELLRENEWLAARDGLEATLVAPEAADGHVPLRTAISELVAAIGPIAESLGDGEALRGVESILERGNAADRIRGRVNGGDSLREIVDWLVQETRTGTGIDRRAQRREEPTTGLRPGESR
jgi:glutamate---cysteine ligase / carboxylate-amine ligase